MKQKLPSLAKITQPGLPEVFPRIRLFKWLDKARGSSVIWVSGPAGAGKTTLIASYIRERKLTPIWYQLDEGDADISTFFHYLGIAVKKAAPHRRKPMPHLTPEYLQGISAFTRRYFEEMYTRLNFPTHPSDGCPAPYKEGRNGGFVVVFDNYQKVPSNSKFHEVIREGLEEIPEGGNIILISRSEPPQPLSRLYANQSMTILGWEDLRLTPTESKGIIKLKHIGKPVRDMTIELHEKSGGWAAGLVVMLEQTIKMSLGGSKATEAILNSDKSEFGSRCETASHDLIFDYFAGEIFKNIDADIQDFLLKTAFLPYMTVRMAAELTGINEAGHILSDLSRKNYFTETLILSEPVYRYHSLFQEFLLSRARESFTKEEIVQIQRRAAISLESEGHVEDAAGLFIKAGDHKGLTELILKHAQSFITQGRGQTLKSWIESLPKDTVKGTPWLLYYLGTCLIPFNPFGGRGYLEKAFESFKSDNDLTGIFLSLCGAVDAIIYEMKDYKSLDSWIAEFEEIMNTNPIFPSIEIEEQTLYHIFISLALRKLYHPKIHLWLERAIWFLQHSKDINIRIWNGYYIGAYYIWTGNYKKASLIIAMIREIAKSPKASPMAVIMARLIDAMYFSCTARYVPCMKAVSEGLKISSATGIHVWDRYLLLHATNCALGVGNLSEAQRMLKQIESGIGGAGTLDTSYYHFLSGWKEFLEENLPQSLYHIETALRLVIDVGMPYAETLDIFGMTQVLHTMGEAQKGAGYLKKAYQIAMQMKSKSLEYMCLIAESQILLDQGKESAGLKMLRRAMQLGREQDYTHFVYWHPANMARLCAKAMEAGIEVEYVQSLIRRRNLTPPNPLFNKEGERGGVENWPYPLKIFTLGRFTILKDGCPLKFTRKAQRRPMELLMNLIASGGRDVNDHEIIDNLCPDAEGDVAYHAFETNLYRLRKLIGDDKAIVHKDGRLTLNPSCCYVDVWALEEILKKLDITLKEKHKKTTEERLNYLIEKALTLYHGRFLSNVTDKSCFSSPRERLHNKFLRHLSEAGQYWENAGKWEKARECYQKCLEVDNLHEEFYRRLMVCCKRLNRRAEALTVYNRCRNTLFTILGINPSPETEFIRKTL